MASCGALPISLLRPDCPWVRSDEGIDPCCAPRCLHCHVGVIISQSTQLLEDGNKGTISLVVRAYVVPLSFGLPAFGHMERRTRHARAACSPATPFSLRAAGGEMLL